MVRQYSQLHQKYVPQTSEPHKYESVLSRLNDSSGRLNKQYPRSSTPSNVRSIKSYAQDTDLDTANFFRDFDNHTRDSSRMTRQENLDDDDDLENWDEETTIVAMLQDDFSDDDEKEDLAALAEQLRAPMATQGQHLKQHMRDSVIPAIQQVKKVHEILDDEVDLAFGAGLLAFDEVCKRVEAMTLRDEDELKDQYIQMQKNTKNLLTQLESAYNRRDQLWVKLEEDLSQCADGAKTAVESLPVEIEETIVRLEKKCKDMEKKGNSAASKQKMLKGLLERL
ncbi:unnamed protein product [Somion occarium]|uniref:Uncharacterized protein n=1 Tax=Somion occarium TaxID=3059160 RepID=A0ABP1DDY9_9APHY